MATQKFDGLLIGKGAINQNTTSTRLLASSATMDFWFISYAYPLDCVVEYSGSYYRSLVGANLGNQPNTSPSQWEILAIGSKDGDMVSVVNGTISDLMIRTNSRWVSLVGLPISATLADATLGQTLLSIPLTVATGAVLEYTINRGANIRRGTLKFQSDGNLGVAGVVVSDHDIVDIGPGDVGVDFSGIVDGFGNVQILADTDAQGSNPLVKYAIKGWT